MISMGFGSAFSGKLEPVIPPSFPSAVLQSSSRSSVDEVLPVTNDC